MLLSLLFASSLLGQLPPSAAKGPEEAPSQPRLEVETYVVSLDGELGLRDRLIRGASVLADAGSFVVAELDQALASQLSARGHELTAIEDQGLELWLAPEGHMRELDAVHARLLFREPSGGASLFGLEPAAAVQLQRELARGGHGHCGLAPIGNRRLMPAAPLTWRGQRGASGPLAMSAGDPRVQALVDGVVQANISAKVAALSANFTRRADSGGALVAQADLEGWLAGSGLQTQTQSFGPAYSSNVIAELPGATHPERIVVIGAHYDSVNWADGAQASAPGADDNASGSAGVLEAARVLASGGTYENTLRFVLFSGEELGLLGSAFNASQSKAQGEEIIAMLNMDMIAYRQAGDARDVDFATNNSSASLTAFCQAVGALYVPSWASTSGVLTAGSSDHASFHAQGFPAAFLFEDLTKFYANIHTALDTMALSTTDFDLAEMIVKGVVASAATLAEPVDMDISHTPLADSLDGVGPYLVDALVTSQTAASVSSVTLHYSSDGVNFTSVSMVDTGSGHYQALIPGLGSPVTIAYWIEALDSAGGFESLPTGAELGGAVLDFFVGQKTILFFEDFEGPGDAGWTHGQSLTQDDWQRGQPAGQAGDPAVAASGSAVWGNDLGAPGWNGSYKPNVSNWLRSPAIDASGTTSLHLEFERWLGVEDATYDQAQVFVGGQLVWQNPAGSDTVDSSWTHQDLDITQAGAGDPALEIEFRLLSDGGLEFGGWNLDDLVVSVQGPAPPPVAPSFSLTPASLPALGWVEVDASGVGLGGVLDLRLDGVSVAFTQGAGQVSFQAPPATLLAPIDVAIETAAGIGHASASVVPTSAAAVLAGAPSAAPGASASFTVGSSSSAGVAWLIASGKPGPTSLPGIVDVSIGGGDLASLLLLGSGSLNAAGNWSTAVGLASDPALSGLVVQLEGLVLDPASGFAVSGSQVFSVL